MKLSLTSAMRPVRSLRAALVGAATVVVGACPLIGQSPAVAPPGFTVTHTIAVGRGPHGIRFSADGMRAFVALSGDGQVAVIDLTTMRVIEKIPAGQTPLDLMATGVAGTDWMVTQFRADAIVPLRGRGAQWRVGGGPSLFSPRAVRGLVAISSELIDTMSVIDVRTGAIVARYPTGRRPYPPDVTADGVLAFVPNRDASTVTVIDLLNERVVAATPVCDRPQGGALTRDDVSYIVACGGSNELAYINTASWSVTGRVAEGVGPHPFAVTISNDGRWGLVNNSGGRTVSVLDVPARRVVGQIVVDSQPIVIRMHPDGRRAFVSNEVGGTVSVIALPAAPPRRVGTRKNEVLMLGMIHGEHRTSTRYGTDVLRALITAIRPDYVLTEIPPNRFEAAAGEFTRNGTITESRVMRFPEYVDVLFPLTRDLPFTIIPTAGWTSPMDAFRTAALKRIAADPARRSDWAAYEAANRRADSLLAARGADDPRYINSDAYDQVQAAAHEPYNRLFNVDLGPGGWDNINTAHYGNIARALDLHAGEGKRFLITYGAGHKEWFMRELRKRRDIVLLAPEAFLTRVGR